MIYNSDFVPLFFLQKYTPESPADATRNLSQQCLNALAKVIPGFLGGSADLALSNMTLLKIKPYERSVAGCAKTPYFYHQRD